jgi:hypothetical protein
MNQINDFLTFVKLNEQTGALEPTGMYAVGGTPEEIASQEDFICETAMMNPKKLNQVLRSTLSEGASVLSTFDYAWKKRIQSGVDSGPLRKVGEWYVGEGAWRINSAKAKALGMMPAYMEYYDPAEEQILKEYFSETSQPKKTEVPSEKELELELAENLKHIKPLVLNEQADFTLGPPQHYAEDAVVLDADGLKKKLIQNFNLSTRKNLMIWGAPAVAKTSIVKEVAMELSKKYGFTKEKSMPVLIVTLATKEASDLSGLPLLVMGEGVGKVETLSGETTELDDVRSQFIVDPKYLGKIGTAFSFPAWLPSPDDNRDGILFFDELNRASRNVLAASLTLLLDRKSGSYEIPNGYRIWAAGNRDIDAPVTPLEAAIASRMASHYHLIPTINAWSKWTRSDNALTNGYYFVPDEFLTFLRQRDIVDFTSKGDSGSDRVYYDEVSGKSHQIKFKYFYNFDQAKFQSSKGGQMAGFPTPRTWAMGFEMVTDNLLNEYKEVVDGLPNTIDEKKRAIAAFSVLLASDKEFQIDATQTLKSAVGSVAVEFIAFAKFFSQMNDANGTLIDKIENIFNNPSGPRVLLDIPKLPGDKVHSILVAVEERVYELLDSGKLGLNEFINLKKYLIDAEDSGKIERSQAATLVKTMFDNSSYGTRIVAAYLEMKKDPNLTQDHIKIAKEFASRFQELILKIRKL